MKDLSSLKKLESASKEAVDKEWQMEVNLIKAKKVNAGDSEKAGKKVFVNGGFRKHPKWSECDEKTHDDLFESPRKKSQFSLC